MTPTGAVEHLAALVGAERIHRDQPAGPYLELRLFPARSRQHGNGRNATTVHTPPGVTIHTGPAGMPVPVDTPHRLRNMARQLEQAAAWLEDAQNEPADPGATPTILDALAELEQENPAP